MPQIRKRPPVDDVQPAKNKQPGKRAIAAGQFQEKLVFARSEGLLSGARNVSLQGRMPEKLVERARARAGVKTDTQLIEVALANLAVADEYTTWLLSKRGSIGKDVDLEF
jgi:hypothetical protein